MFGKKIELSENDIEKLNAGLPEELRRNNLSVNNIIKGNYLNEIIALIDKKTHQQEVLSKSFQEFKKALYKPLISKIQIFNGKIEGSEDLGMVDLGVVKRFTSASTGNKFENGLIGYAIESSMENVWAKNNFQMQSLNEAKFSLLSKAKDLFPNCNSLSHYDVDFRELGASGNVFIYLRGNACITKKYSLKNEEEKIEKKLNERTETIKNLEIEIEKLRDYKSKFPSNTKTLKEFLGIE